jgi:predicted transcriptional regulator
MTDDDSGETYTGAMAAFVERSAGDLVQGGMPRMPARVFSCLLVSQESTLSSVELAERLHISAAAVSGAVRYLAQTHLLSRERQPGSRREHFRLHHNVWYEAVADRDAMLARWAATMRAGVDVVGGDSPAGRRMGEASEFLQFLQQEMESILHRWHAHRAAR